MKIEEMIKRIEDIAKILEKGEIALDTSIVLYEEAVELIHKCGLLLDEAEQKVMVLTRGENGLAVVPFDTSTDE